MTKILKYATNFSPRFILRLRYIETAISFTSKFSQPIQNNGLLEIGSGKGDFLDYALNELNYSSYTSIDFSEEACQLLFDRFSKKTKLNIINGTIDELGDTNYSLICAFEVIEHIEDDQSFLIKLSNLLAPGGIAIFSVPAHMKYWQNQDVYAGHVRRYEKQELITKLTKAGLTPVKIIEFGAPVMNLLKPIKQWFYKTKPNSSLQERTKNSGIVRPNIGTKTTNVMKTLYIPIVWLCNIFPNKGIGDGYIVITRK